MIKEAIEKILDLRIPEKIIDKDAREYSTVSLSPIQEPRANKLTVHTLTGITEFVNENFDGYDQSKDLMVHIEDNDNVRIVTEFKTDNWKRRTVVISANTSLLSFGYSFGQQYDVEKFIIGLMSNFELNDTLVRLIKTVGNMTAERVKTAVDDGVSQTVSSRSGSHMVEAEKLPNPVMLRPRRTFLEAEQPESAFVFRVRQREDDIPTCALYEADGGAWRNQAVLNIKKYLKAELPDGMTIIA